MQNVAGSLVSQVGARMPDEVHEPITPASFVELITSLYEVCAMREKKSRILSMDQANMDQANMGQAGMDQASMDQALATNQRPRCGARAADSP
jgi:hypothetical protein